MNVEMDMEIGNGYWEEPRGWGMSLWMQTVTTEMKFQGREKKEEKETENAMGREEERCVGGI